MDLIYGTKREVNKHELLYPNDKVFAADASKGIITNGNQDIKRGANWVTSQRAIILLTKSQIICGKWIIPLEEIESSELFKISSIFADGMVLKIQTKNDVNYQFGMQFNTEWMEQNILPLTIEKTKVKYSAYSIIVRLILVGFWVFWLYNRYAR